MCTDIVLALTRFLRSADVLAAVVEFCGPALDRLALPDRATIANMAPEYGATMGFFPVDAETLRYLAQTGRSAARIDLVERYAKAQGMWRAEQPAFQTLLEFDLSQVEPSLAGPSRPESLVTLGDAPQRFSERIRGAGCGRGTGAAGHVDVPAPAARGHRHRGHRLLHQHGKPISGDRGGPARPQRRRKGLRTKPWVKTSFSPGSRVVPAMLAKAGLAAALDNLGFQLVGFGCMTCGSGSGLLADKIAAEIAARELVVGMISSNRNFEGR